MDTATEQSRSTRDEDAALIERLRRGDREAFDEVVRRHRRPVYLVARRLLGSHEDADEAAQMAFVKAWQALSGFRGDAALRTWLIRIVINVARTMRSSRKAVSGLDTLEEMPDPGAGSEERVRLDQLRGRVREAVAGLPPRQQEVVMLKVFSEMTHREVAEAMELSEGTVKAHLHQAVSNLRRLMGDDG